MASLLFTAPPSNPGALSTYGWICNLHTPAETVQSKDWNSHISSEHTSDPDAALAARTRAPAPSGVGGGGSGRGAVAAQPRTIVPTNAEDAIGVSMGDLIQYRPTQTTSDGALPYTVLNEWIQHLTTELIPGVTLDRRSIVGELALYLVRTDATSLHQNTGSCELLDTAGNNQPAIKWEDFWTVSEKFGTNVANTEITARRAARAMGPVIKGLLERGTNQWEDMRTNGTQLSRSFRVVPAPPHWAFLSFFSSIIPVNEWTPSMLEAQRIKNAYAQLRDETGTGVTSERVTAVPAARHTNAYSVMDTNSARLAGLGMRTPGSSIDLGRMNPTLYGGYAVPPKTS